MKSYLPFWCCYLHQGMITALSLQGVLAYFRHAGMDLAQLSWLSLCMLPWVAKFLWAPWGERHALPLRGKPYLGSLVLLPVTFLTPRTYAQVLWLLPLLGFFNNGIFSGFPIYLPELYPTRIRATGAGFCFNIGRVLAAVGPFVTGYLVTVLGSFGRAASAVALIYLLGLLILPFARETKGQPLPQ